MRRLRVWRDRGITLVVIAGIVASVSARSGSHDQVGATPTGAACRVQGSGDLVRPDDGCTPGAFDRLSRAAVCRHKQRPSLPVTERLRILREYGVPAWSGRDGELDHRVPFFLGGKTTEDNLWPERGEIPNEKDRVENEVRRRVCKGSMTVAQARAVFLGDWTKARGL